jgi:hypothetical protein
LVSLGMVTLELPMRFTTMTDDPSGSIARGTT